MLFPGIRSWRIRIELQLALSCQTSCEHQKHCHMTSFSKISFDLEPYLDARRYTYSELAAPRQFTWRRYWKSTPSIPVDGVIVPRAESYNCRAAATGWS